MKLQVKRLAFHIFNEFIFRVFFDSFFHLGLDWQDKLVLWERRHNVVVVVFYKLSWTVFCGEEFFIDYDVSFHLYLLDWMILLGRFALFEALQFFKLLESWSFVERLLRI